MPIAQLASRLTPRAWLIAGGATVAAIIFFYLFLHIVTQPSYTTLVSGVDPSQTGKMTSTLSAQGDQLPAAEQRHRARGAVQPDLPGTRRARERKSARLRASPVCELFEKQKLGESNFQQQVTYQRALQGQLEQTINSVQGVSGAQVELVLPSSQSQVFGESQGVSSAAVLLSGTTSIDAGSVRGIAQLVTSSVPGLQLSKVTITDASGQLLWPQAGASSGGAGTSVQDAEQRYDQNMAASLDSMLAQTLGVGKAQVLVYANLNVDQTTKESLEYVKERRATDADEGSSRRSPATAPERAQRPVLRRSGLVPPAGGKSNYKKETTNSSLGVGKVVTHSTVAPGSCRKRARLGAARPLGPRRLAARDPRSRNQRGRHPDQAR